ncbi:MAG TPA: lipase maturation factor family protein [Bryobacteraceae bacterium]|nr:lipase maturation factor family protein [Bryobacteraceae bacterium]
MKFTDLVFPDSGNYWLTRLVFQRSLGVIYFIAFLCAINQFRPLLGEHGLLPVPLFVRQASFRQTPSLFFFAPKDWAFALAGWIGLALSVLTVTGIAERGATWMNAVVWAAMWALYLSFVNVGQVFYAFGWESILLEAGFFAIFLGARDVRPSLISIWLLRWLEFRIMFGAGLIKLRGDPCWRNLTCLDYHYETQPMPNPLSWYFQMAPEWTHKAGVAFNHFSELIVPFFYFLPQPVASIAAAITIVFQATIFASGNLSWLNALTIVLAIPAIDGRYISALIPIRQPALNPPSIAHNAVLIALAVLVGILSIDPVRNMLSPMQIMNTSFNPLHLVGTYGAFGSISRERYEVVVEGTSDAVITPATQWKEYEFKGKPNDVRRMPPQIAPYHLRLDWLMWFAAMSRFEEHPWFLNFVAKLLENNKPVLSLLRSNPFPDRAPRFVRAELYQYRFARPEIHRRTGQWWVRTRVGPWFPEVSLENPAFKGLLQQEGWL